MLALSAIEQNVSTADSVTETECRLLRCSLSGADFSFDENCDWRAVYDELFSQTVESIPGDIVMKLPLAPELKAEWKKTCFWRIGQFYKVLSVQSELVKLLEKEGIDFVILKGTAAAMYYPRPQYRTMGDVDFIVAPEQFERAYELLVRNGFADEDGEFDRHRNLVKDGCEFEMHRYFSLKGDSDGLMELDSLIFDGVKNAQHASIDGESFPVLPPLQNGLVLLQHIKHHLRRSLGMRQILDWMLFADRCLTDEFWYAEFAAEAEKAELKALALGVTRMCQLYLGLKEENMSWCLDADETVCRQLFEHVITNGNMGEKRTDTLQKATDLRDGPLSLLKNLQPNGVKSWKALEKFPWLKPFAWLYQLCHHIKSLFRYRISPAKIAKHTAKLISSEEMFKKLGCPDDIVGE